jgi:two-component system phosphate regulon sensor histidine kinase PhoR
LKEVLRDVLKSLLLATLIGLAGGGVHGWIGAVLALLAYALFRLVRHTIYLRRLIDWARTNPYTPPPEGGGSWGDAFFALNKRMRQTAEQRDQLELALERFRQVAEALPDGVMILDGNRHIEWMNMHAEAALGLHTQSDTGARLTHLVREPEVVNYLDQGDYGKALDFQTSRNPGHRLQLQLAPFSAGRQLLIVRDVTQLEALATMRRDFVANVSHELKTPLTVTLGFLETLQDGLHDTPPEELQRYLALATEQARRMQHLIDDLLTLSSLQTDAQPAEEDVAVGALLNEIRAETQALSAGRHTIHLDVAAASRLLGSERELHSAFGNLASNAVRYTPDGGSIRLKWRELPSGGGEFCVHDSGIGIPAEHLHRLTERFYRVDRGRSRDSGGTGLGLAIVKHVLERHNATLQISSSPGDGSKFCVEFPPHRVR